MPARPATKKRSAKKLPRARDVDGKRARLDVSARRSQLVALGLKAFTEQSFDDVSIDEVAKAAGISKGLLYHYFPSKKAFYVATLRAAAAQLLDATAPDPSVSPLERLEQGLDAFLLYAEEHSNAYAALLTGGASVDREVMKILEATRARFQTRLLEGLPSELNHASMRLLSRGFVALVETATLEWVERMEMTRDELRALLVQTLLAILGAQWQAAPRKKQAR